MMAVNIRDRRIGLDGFSGATNKIIDCDFSRNWICGWFRGMGEG